MLKYLSIAVLAAFLASCSSDPEAPVTGVFSEEGSYDIEAGETQRYVGFVEATPVAVTKGVGTSKLLKLGEIRGIRFEAILMAFDLTIDEGLDGRTVTSAVLDLPVRVASPADTLSGGSPEDFSVEVTFHELLGAFEESDTMSSVPPYDAGPIEDSLGGTVRSLGITSTEFSLSPDIVQGWLEGTATHNGIAIVPVPGYESAGLIEINAADLESDPPVVRVTFDDASGDTFAVEKDYSIAAFTGDGLDCVGGVARRIHFEFDLDGLPDSVMIHYSALLLHIDGERGMGATPGENDPLILDYSTAFPFYLYTPESADRADTLFLKGTGINLGEIDPNETQELEIPLGPFTPDVVRGLRGNTGVVFQSNVELSRVQRVSFFPTDADSLQRPRLEIIYSFPAKF